MSKQEEKDAEIQRRTDEIELAKKYQDIFLGSEHGKEVLDDLLAKCHVFHTSMTGNSWTYFREGERNVGLYIMDQLNANYYEALKKIEVSTTSDEQEDNENDT